MNTIKDIFKQKLEEEFEDVEYITKDDIFELLDEIGSWAEEDEDDIAITLINILYDIIDSINDNDQETLNNIYEVINDDFIEEFEDDDWEDDLEESELSEFVKKKKKIKASIKIKRRKEYRRNKAQIKRKLKKYRKTSAFRRYKKKAARFAKRGKTSTGKRQTTII